MTILEENHHSVLIVEHDPLLYEDAGEMVEYLAQALKQTSREATILLYAPALDPHLQKITELADWVFCIYNEQAPAKGRKAEAKMPRARFYDYNYNFLVSSIALERNNFRTPPTPHFRATF